MFEEAENYLKEILTLPVELSIKEINKQLKNDRIVPGLKLIVTGGQAIESYFPNSPPLRTHDFDLKLVAPKYSPVNENTKKRMLLLARGIVRYLEKQLNAYLIEVLPKIKGEIKSRYGLELVSINSKVFKSVVKLKNNLLHIVSFKHRDAVKTRTNSLVDVYVVDPKEIVEHYKTFTGLEGSNPILSEDAGDYYIPIKYINGIPYSGMGYVLWDTLRMIDNTKETRYVKNSKYDRYVQKKDAIIQALNDPNQKLSCNSMKDYIKTCAMTYSDCEINGKKFTTTDSILRYALEEEVIPVEFYQKIKDNYDINYVCTSVKKMLEK